MSRELGYLLRLLALALYLGTHVTKLEVEYGKMAVANPPLMTPLISTTLLGLVFVLTWFYREKK